MTASTLRIIPLPCPATSPRAPSRTMCVTVLTSTRTSLSSLLLPWLATQVGTQPLTRWLFACFCGPSQVYAQRPKGVLLSFCEVDVSEGASVSSWSACEKLLSFGSQLYHYFKGSFFKGGRKFNFWTSSIFGVSRNCLMAGIEGLLLACSGETTPNIKPEAGILKDRVQWPACCKVSQHGYHSSLLFECRNSVQSPVQIRSEFP